VTIDELRACGLTDDAVRVRVRRGNLHPLHRGVYVVGHPNLSMEGRFLAAVKACGDFAALSHFCAACLRGWLRYDGRPIDVTALGRRRRPGINTHVTDTLERTIVDGIPVTTRVRTIIDLARTEDERTTKRALRQARFSAAELELLPARITGLGTAPTASGNEDFVFDLIVAAGFVEPLVNARYPGSNYFPDLWWPDQGLIVEVDSKEFHDAPLDQRDDLDRQAWLEARGERVLRTTRPQVRRDPAMFLERLRQAGAPYTRSAQTQL
jgi:Protein of unknown function (DUF559)